MSELVREMLTDGVREKGPDTAGGVPYVRVSDMTKRVLSRDGMLCMESDLAASNQSSLMRAGDLVMALRSKIGLCHLVPDELDGCNIAQGVAKFAPDFEKVSSEYLFEVLMAPRTQAELDRVAKGTTIREVALKALRAFTIPFPPDRVKQAVIVTNFQLMRAAVSDVEQRIEAASMLRQRISTETFGDAS